MSIVFLQRVDAAPLDDDDFSFSFNSWISNTIDSLNETILNAQNGINGVGGFSLTNYTTAQIAAFATNAPDGTLWYDSSHIPPCFVAKINGALVQFVTAAYP